MLENSFHILCHKIADLEKVTDKRMSDRTVWTIMLNPEKQMDLIRRALEFPDAKSKE